VSSEREPTLTMLFGEGQELIFPIKQSRTTIGRDIENDIVLRDAKISKIHAAIIKDNSGIWIEDLDSKNGVYVNGRKIEGKKKLMNGNLVKLGFTIFRFECA
jgi:pSer/pThr/pTyr-binding forkhead associated (FHA) protein